MQNKLTKRLVLCGLFGAIVMVVTMLVRIPLPFISAGSYINAGDAVIYAAAVVLGGPWGAAAAGIGSMLADLLVGAAMYAPGTLVIKALMGLAVGLLAGRESRWPRLLLAMSVGGVIMVAGYALYEAVLIGPAWLASVPYNLLQLAGGVALGIPLTLAIRRAMTAVMKEW